MTRSRFVKEFIFSRLNIDTCTCTCTCKVCFAWSIQTGTLCICLLQGNPQNGRFPEFGSCM